MSSTGADTTSDSKEGPSHKQQQPSTPVGTPNRNNKNNKTTRRQGSGGKQHGRDETTTTKDTTSSSPPSGTKDADGNTSNNLDSLLQSIATKANQVFCASTSTSGPSNSNSPSKSVNLTIYIPSASVGAVIGRRGQNIANLQKLAWQASASHGPPIKISVMGGNNVQPHQWLAAAAAAQYHSPHTNIPSTPTGALADTTADATTNSSSNNSNTNTPTTTNKPESIPYTYSPLDFSDPNWTPVVIRADPKAAFTAALKLEESIKGNGSSSASSNAGPTSNATSSAANNTSGTPPPLSSSSSFNTSTTPSGSSTPLSTPLDGVVLDVPISRTKHSAIVGKRGLTLANISADTNVRIMVPNKDLRHDVIQLEGDYLPNVIQCLDRILTVACKANANNNAKNAKSSPSHAVSDDPKPSPSQTQQTPQQQQVLVVQQLPPKTKLRFMERKTDTTIRKKKIDTDNWQMIVSGPSSDKISQAIVLLQKWHDNATGNTTTETSATVPSASSSPSQGGPRKMGRPRGGRNNNNNNNKGTPKRGKKGGNSGGGGDTGGTDAASA